ncbi:MAG TPA: hypothetical protein H9891_02945 [Candidatus Salinicoccus stercoripullorum]|uniref:Uncharacterized protein n=1 Tax=Candidatus Salinicoccus stercoripullorum TaxID=2838756 RepID=A0A9D1QG13_9STAP|nr:hypothetical protein [Candidatus Salinicoccus stercoripullorum]
MENDMETISLIKTGFDLKDREVVCYPYLIITFKIHLPRLFLKPRIAYTVVTADLVKGAAARSNMFPETEEVDIQESSIVPDLIEEEEALTNARKTALRWIMYKFHSFRAPRIEVIQRQKAYKAFFHADVKGRTVLIDSVKGLEQDDIR